MMTRLRFILVLFLALSMGLQAQKTTKLVILHTNDTHSQVEPISGNDKGGFARRLGVINKIRSEEKNVLLFDAGDFWQGTPYFNFFGGRVEVNALKMMGYDAVTLGNHEFDIGMDSLAKALKNVNLPIVSANYNVENTPIKEFVKPYKIIKKGGLKIGVFGLGIDLKGLAFQKNYEGLIFKDPVETGLEISVFLKETLKCDFVICLSHLGISSLVGAATDYDLAAASSKIDLIIGGHSHSIILNEKVKNAEGKPVIIAQAGRSGENLGRIDLEFEKKKQEQE